MCDELKPFEFTTPGWYARRYGNARDVVYVVTIAPTCLDDCGTPLWFIGTDKESHFIKRDGTSSCNGTLAGPCLGTDPERPPKPLVMKAMCWYVAWRGDLVCVTHKSRGLWFGTFVLNSGECNGYCRFDDLGNAVSGSDRPRNKIVREHVGPLPWEKPCSP